MAQEKIWEKEYQNPKLVTQYSEPQSSVLRFFKFLKRKMGIGLKGLNVLDLGSGTGRNANYMAQKGAGVIGLEISETAINLARSRAKELGINIDYRKHDIGSPYPFKDNSFDLVLDIVSSNSLNERERYVYLKEMDRVLKPKGYFLIRALCKDGDKNAKKLLETYPGREKDTYIMPEMDLIERVFSREDFISVYSRYFDILKLIKKTTYTPFNQQNYKRNFWIGYMRKKI